MTHDEPFAALLDRYVDEDLAADPVKATALGVTTYDDRLPDLTADGRRARAAATRRWLDAVTAVDPAGLTADERLDRELAISALRGDEIVAGWESWRRSPEDYLGAALNGVHLLLTHRLRDGAALADAVRARLSAVPDLLAAARDNLDPALASPVIVGRFLPQALGAGAWLRGQVPAECGEHAAVVAPAAEAAADAMDAFGAWLRDFADRASGDFALGEERYTALLQERDGLPYGARELREVGARVTDDLVADLTRRCRAERGDDDWRGWLAALNADRPADAEAMRAGYEAQTLRARGFCAERGLVSFADGERCEVIPSPGFQRAVLAVAAYLPPPAFSGSRTGRFWVPFPPDGATGEQVAQRLESNSWSLMPTIAVHETYPGHHWHLSWFAAQPVSRLRRIAWSTFFIEGWGLYVEEMMREQGFHADDPAAEARQVDCRLFRAARIVVDTSLHLGEMTVDEAVAHMQHYASLSEETARAEVLRYCSWPTQAASYLTGALEIQRIRDDYVAAGGDLRRFHDLVAGAGALPLRLVADLAAADVRA